MNTYKYEFSVVMAVYNVEKYLREAIDSIIQQTIGFSNIQLILVDDGSTDHSGEICDEYKRKYAENIIVIHKNNGGASTARNAGLQYVTGKYLNFMDSDDKFDLDVFKKVKHFFEKYSNETDAVAIPMVFFGAESGEHPQNYKFSYDGDIINLVEYPYLTNFSAASTFFISKAAKGIEFDARLTSMEDAKYVLTILLKKMTLGIIKDVAYWYRRRTGEQSASQTGEYRKEWYIEQLKLFSNWVLDYSEECYGAVPTFVQYAVMYDLQWKFRQEFIPESILTQDETKEYQTLLLDTVRRIDDEIILMQKRIGTDKKLFLAGQKYCECISSDTQLMRERNAVEALSKLGTVICFIDIIRGELILEGHQTYPLLYETEPQIYAVLNEKRKISAVRIKHDEQVYSAGILVAKRVYFKITIPLNKFRKSREFKITFKSQLCDLIVDQKNVSTGRYAPVSNQLKRSWYIKDGYLIVPCENGIQVQYVGNHNLRVKFVHEISFLWELIADPSVIAKKAVVCRLIYHILHHVAPPNIWLIMDKMDRADDNAEAFFKYLVSLGQNAGCIPIFAIGKKSPDYKRIKKIGIVIPYLSWRHKIIHLLAQHTISAYGHPEISSPFTNYSKYYGDLLQRNKIVFLQHGITKDDVSRGLNRFNKNFSMVITAAERERRSFIEGNYAYSEDQVVLTGFTRYDLLYNNTQKYVTVMPTWSSKLCGKYIAEEGRWEILPGFEKSEYCQFYSNLLNDSRLLKSADELGYKIRFLIHPIFQQCVDLFVLDRRIQVLHSDICYRDVFAESALIATDYSSVAFDFAYLKKPLIYTQFEESNYDEGYFDYERDGFGEVEHTVDGAVNCIIDYMKNGCILKKKYEERIDRFFFYQDKKNCERVYNAIRKSDGIVANS